MAAQARRQRNQARYRAALEARGVHHSPYPLMDATINRDTARRYRSLMNDFLEWADDERAATDAALDMLIVEYFHERFADGYGKSSAEHLLFAWSHFMPEVRGMLPRAAQCVRGWNKLVPVNSHPPLTWDLAVAIGVRLAGIGKKRHGVAVLLGFDCLLRVGELCALRREDVVDGGVGRLGRDNDGRVVLRLRKTKTGNEKSVEVLDPSTIALLRDVVARTAPGDRIFPFSTANFRAAMKAACAAMGLSERYVPHSLRHGGATRYRFFFKWTLEQVMERGRWAASRTTKRYIQSGRALAMSMDVPAALAAAARVLAMSVVTAFALFAW